MTSALGILLASLLAAAAPTADIKVDQVGYLPSAELWRTTGEDVYERQFLEHVAAFRAAIRPVGPQAWPSVAPLGLRSYVLGHGANAEAVAAIRGDSLAAADAIVR